MTAVVEYLWIQVVYTRFPILAIPDNSMVNENDGYVEVGEIVDADRVGIKENLFIWAKTEMSDWSEFARLPIFCSEFSLGFE